ncbi:BamA/TamA family outer membrane protein [Octadecabacter sp. G9-8]|uniref:BamA/TamA family outer membrane protein n=1 Tax=Octadecabacter dasysiphoniae TaxID=2909341 RepID=A0ABS9CYK6_9RHOB|nr:BamA/TamA family outer membrane protein [Octadecabacter dasysiphoniae]MCF2872360.1 BamA/TamA family outer membrane protein [Octadecabacter dasysiphoniae]
MAFLRTTCLVCGLASAGSTVMAQDGGSAALQTGASYSSLRGGLAFVGLDAENVLGSGVDLSLGYQAGDDGDAITGLISKTFSLGDTAIGSRTFVRTTLEARTSDWESQTYSMEHYAADVTIGAQTIGGLRYDARLFWQSDSLGDLGPNVSPLVPADLDGSTAVGVGIGFDYSTFTATGPMATGFDVHGSLTVATPAGDREWIAAELGAQYNTQLPYGLVLAVNGDVGRIEGRGGDDVSIVDRAFVGSDAPRGFTYSGIGPRDRVAGGVNTALGGNSYMTTSVELRTETPNPSVTLGAFVDAGALWDLDVTAGGASGIIDDEFYLRSSAGVAVYWDTAIGIMQLNVAKPIEQQEFDEEEIISLNLNFQF